MSYCHGESRQVTTGLLRKDSTFQYQPLLQQTEFRLLCIPPKTAETPDNLILFHASLEEAEEARYVALSYCWGDPGSVQDIVVNGQAVKVTKNLFAAIQALQRSDIYVVLWADAVRLISQLSFAFSGLR